MAIPTEDWKSWMNRGANKGAIKKRAIERCQKSDGTVRGYYSDMPLDPTLSENHSLYPAIEHLSSASNDTEVAVEARVINDMKAHLSEAEFWQVVEHLYSVGVNKGHIPMPQPRVLPSAWSPNRHY